MMINMQKHVKNTISRAIDIVLPPRCSISGDVVDKQGMLSARAWQGLDFISSPYCECCGKPFGFEKDDLEDEDGSLCMECIEKHPPFKKARAALVYNETSRGIILGFKHGDKTHLVRSFTPWLSNAGHEMLEIADYIVPVPLHITRLMKRRYNQSALIAIELAKIGSAEYLPFALKRVRITPSQGHLAKSERSKNVYKAFAVDAKYKSRIKGKNIILVDDVYTTGATIKECARTLKANGSGEIYVLTLARVVKDD